MSDRARYDQAVARQRNERALATGRPVPYRITQALDSRALYGPEVDEACGGAEPMVDEWEAGTRIPTPEQIELLAALTRYPPEFFYWPAPETSATGFMCSRSGPRGSRCQPVQFGPPPKIAEVIPMRPPGSPGFRCFLPRCPLRGRRQTARSTEAAVAGWRRHYLDYHHQSQPQPEPETGPASRP